jgi:hypothetical protein
MLRNIKLLKPLPMTNDDPHELALFVLTDLNRALCVINQMFFKTISCISNK